MSLGNMCLEEPKEVRSGTDLGKGGPGLGDGEECRASCPSPLPLQELRLEISHLEEQLSQTQEGPDE